MATEHARQFEFGRPSASSAERARCFRLRGRLASLFADMILRARPCSVRTPDSSGTALINDPSIRQSRSPRSP